MISHSTQNQKNLQNSCHLLLNSVSQNSFASFWWTKEDIYFCSAAGNFNTFHLTIKSSCHVLFNYCKIKRACPSEIAIIFHISGDASQRFAMVDKVVLSLPSQLLPCLLCVSKDTVFPVFWLFSTVDNVSVSWKPDKPYNTQLVWIAFFFTAYF